MIGVFIHPLLTIFRYIHASWTRQGTKNPIPVPLLR